MVRRLRRLHRDICGHLRNLRTKEYMNKLTSGATPAEVAADLQPLIDFQDDGLPSADLERLLEQQLIPHLMRYNSPTFQSMFNAFPLPEAQIGADLMHRTNQGVTNWQVSPGGAMLEEITGRALCRLFGLAETADATFMYSGTYANQQALYMALHRFAARKGVDLGEEGVLGMGEKGVAVLVSADAHFSLRHAVRMLGLGERALVKLPVDGHRRIDPLQARQIAADLTAAGREIVCIVGTSGTTSTGSIDPLEPLAEIAAAHQAWFHVDGAYGYAYKLVPEWAGRFAGDTRADSITWDPHKQLGVPIPNSILFVKNGLDFGRMSLYSGYFNRAEDVEPNPGLKSPPTTRPFSALPLVTLLRGRGLAQIRADLRAPLEAIRQLYDELQQRPDFEPCHEPDTGILCFRQVGPAARPVREVYEAVMRSGERSISTTKLDGEMVLRLALVQPRTGIEDLWETIEEVSSGLWPS